MIVQGTTRVTVIIGHPIAQVASPKLFNQHFAERGSDQVMIPADIAPEQLASFLLFLRGWHNCDGCVVTMPHKQGVIAHLDDVQ